MKIPKKHSHNNKTVFVAMSGGVDSSVAAALLKEQGYAVVGITMCFDINHPDSDKPSCCGVEGIESAKKVAHALDIPHYVLSFSKEINEKVIEDFIQQYLAGATPNPCVRCNQYLKFGTLLSKAKSLGADFLATGHYARIVFNEREERFELHKGRDIQKDQSYFLYGMRKDILPSVLFPLGEMTKTQVRALARKYALKNADRPGSQDICFIPPGGYQRFIEQRLNKKAIQPGPFKNEQGEVVGTHKGIAFYTIGQRDGLGIALGRPVYVYRIEKETNTVFVGDKSCLYHDSLVADSVNFISTDPPVQERKVTVRIRYHQPEERASIGILDKERIEVKLERPLMAITPGQSVVFYDGDLVLGGGIISARGAR